MLPEGASCHMQEIPLSADNGIHGGSRNDIPVIFNMLFDKQVHFLTSRYTVRSKAQLTTNCKPSHPLMWNSYPWRTIDLQEENLLDNTLPIQQMKPPTGRKLGYQKGMPAFLSPEPHSTAGHYSIASVVRSHDTCPMFPRDFCTARTNPCPITHQVGSLYIDGLHQASG